MKKEFLVRSTQEEGYVKVWDTSIDNLIGALEQEGVHIDARRSHKHISYLSSDFPNVHYEPRDIPLHCSSEGAYVDEYALKGEGLEIVISTYLKSEGGRYRAPGHSWRRGQYWGKSRTFMGVECGVEASDELCEKACKVLESYYITELQKIKDAKAAEKKKP